MKLLDTEPLALLQAERDAHRAQQLRRVRAVATGLFVAMVALFIAARSQHGLHPVWGFAEAFAEAAMVCALADWFAVLLPKHRSEAAKTWNFPVFQF